MSKKSRPDILPVSPIDFGPVSNGEFFPRAVRHVDRVADRLVHELAEERAKKLSVSRREFLSSAAGTATALGVINALSGCHPYRVPTAALTHPDVAREVLSSAVPEAFVVDVQTHHVEASASAPWLTRNKAYADLFRQVSQARGCSEEAGLRCLSRETYIDEVFVKTEVQVAILSGVPARPGENPLDNASVAVTFELIERLAPTRLLTHGIIHPNLGSIELDAMQALAESRRIVGWKVYTPWGPDGRGFFLDDEKVGIPFLERVRKTGVSRVFLHKGLPWPTFDKQFASPRDIGPAAARFTDLQFICYHSGYEQTVTEGPYQADGAGVDRLITSLARAGIGAGGNVWAELGGTWQLLMTRPIEAAHVLGKLLKAVGEDRILWGSDSLFVGTPQPQIDALRAFQIPEALQEKYGYPALSEAVKRKILGGNAVALLGIDPHATRRDIHLDDIALRKQSAAQRPGFHGGPFGPRTRREFWELWHRHGGRPA